LAQKPIRPFIVVTVNPREIEQGQMLTVSARFFDEGDFTPLFVSRIFMQIQSRQGVEVWPLEVIRKDAAGFDILIGTSEMKSNTEYLLRVSNNWNLSPIASTHFKLKKKPPDISILPLIPAIVAPALIPGLPPARFPVHDVKPAEVENFIFRTQMDARVCPICKQYENIVFSPEVWKPTIPDDTHPRCRCSYDIIFKSPEERTAGFREIAEIGKFSDGIGDAIDAVQAVELIQVEELLNLRNEQTKKKYER